MAALNTSAGVSGSASTLTTASVTPGGSDRYVFGVTAGFFADATAFKYGGSGGTDLTQIGSDITLGGGALTATFWDIAPGPSGSTTAYAAFSGSNANALSAAFYDTVDQTTPTEALQTNSGDNGGFAATAVATITVTGVESGQEVVVGVAIGVQGGPTISSVVAGSDTTVVRSDFGSQSGENLTGTAILRGVAAGTSITLSATITVSSTFGDLRWIAGARPLVSAAGAGDDYTLTAEGGTFTYSGGSAGLVFGRVLGANGGTYTYSGTAASLLRRFNLSAEGGTYTYTGGAAGLVAGRVLGANGGSYSYTGQDATLTYTPVGSYSLTAEAATYSYSGGNASLVYGRVLQALGGTYSYTGADAGLTYAPDVVDYTLTCDPASFSMVVGSAEFVYSGGPPATGANGAGTHRARKRRILEDVEVVEPVKAAPAAPTPAPAPAEPTEAPATAEPAIPAVMREIAQALPQPIKAKPQRKKAAPVIAEPQDDEDDDHEAIEAAMALLLG
jgi:hypothetical protein